MKEAKMAKSYLLSGDAKNILFLLISRGLFLSDKNFHRL